MSGPDCIFKNHPAICVRTVGQAGGSDACSMCETTLPYILHMELEKVRDQFRDTNTYNQWLQKIEEKWRTTAPDTDRKYACVARQSRFRNPSNPTGKLLLEKVAEARVKENGGIIADNTDTVDDVGHAKCVPVAHPEMLCENCSYAVSHPDAPPEAKGLFIYKEGQQELEVTEKVTEDVIKHRYP